MSVVKRITDAEQLLQRQLRQTKEKERLLQFSIRTTLKPFLLPKQWRESHSDNVQVKISELDYKQNKYIVIGETERLQLPSNKQHLLYKGDMCFHTLTTRSLEMGIIQHMKITVWVYNKSNEDAIELAQGEFDVSDLCMNLERVHNVKLTYVQSGRTCKGGGVILQLIPPTPTEHVLPRVVNQQGTHVTLLDEHIMKFGEVEAKQMSITLKVQCKDLPSMDLLSKSVYPYLVVFKDGIKFKERLYRSETIDNSCDPVFRTFSFGLEGERSLSKPMLIELWHHNSLQNDQFIGIMTSDIFDLRSNNNRATYKLIQPDTPNVFRGTCQVIKYEERVWITDKVMKRYVSKRTRVQKSIVQTIHRNDFSILHYLGYYELRLAVAIDFTASNGSEPKINTRSLHYIGGHESSRNPYERTMVGVMNAIYQWGNEQQEMHMYGFGALNARGVFEITDYSRLSTRQKVTNTRTMLESYRRCVNNVIFGVDSNFGAIISQVAKMSEPVQHYFVLLVVCDGDPSDVQGTCDILKGTQHCGLSIVFVGMGDCPFHHLKRFEQECRNVTFTRYTTTTAATTTTIDLMTTGGEEAVERTVARNALRDVPQHMLEYFASRKVVPEIY